jgi:hypothetical protein
MRDCSANDEALGRGRHEVSDASARGVTLNGVALALILLGIFFVLGALYRHFAAQHPKTGNSNFSGYRASEPRLQTNEAQELARVRAEEERALNQYAWVNPQSNSVRIPIARAMELLVQHGLPTNGIETNKTRLEMSQQKALIERSKP